MFFTVDINALDEFFQDACNRYEKTAPHVYNYLNDLYFRMHKKPETVTLLELNTIQKLQEEGIWLDGNYAQNLLFRMVAAMGKNTTGMTDH